MIQALTLLTMALQLLVAANQSYVPVSIKLQVASVANLAIRVANRVLSEQNLQSISTSVGTVTPVKTTNESGDNNIITPSPLPDISSPIISPESLTITFVSDREFVPYGETFTLTWNSTGADYCGGGGGSDAEKLNWIGEPKPTAGTRQMRASEVKDFKISLYCRNSYATQDSWLIIKIREPNHPIFQ